MVTKRSMPESRSRPPRPRPKGRGTNSFAGSWAAYLDPDSVWVLDVCEQTRSLNERRMADPCPLRKQLSVSPLDVLAGERDVVELVPVAIRSCEELGAIGIPVQFEQLFRSSTAKLCPFTLCFRNMLTADDLHSKSVPVERDRTVHVSHLNPDVREFVAHETDGPSHPQRIRDFPPNDGAQRL